MHDDGEAQPDITHDHCDDITKSRAGAELITVRHSQSTAAQTNKTNDTYKQPDMHAVGAEIFRRSPTSGVLTPIFH